MNNNDIPDYVRSQLRDYLLFVTWLNEGKAKIRVASIQSKAIQIVNDFDQKLAQQQISEMQRSQICYALFALIDEIALRYLAPDERLSWESTPLQVAQFGNYAAGIKLFEDIKTELGKPDASFWLLSVWRFVFALGFSGQYLFSDTTKSHELISMINQRLPAIVIPAIKVNHKLRTISLRSFSAVGWSITLLVVTVFIYLILNKYLINLVTNIN